MLYLLFPGHDDALVQHLEKLVETLFPKQDMKLFDNLKEALGYAPQSPIVLPVLTPVEAVAQRLSNGDTPEQALEAWTTQAREDLPGYRKARRNLVMVSLYPLLGGTPESWETLVRRLDLNAKSLNTLNPETFPTPSQPAPSSFYCLLAGQLLRHSAPAQALADEFEAMLNGPYTSLDISPALIEQVWQDHRAGLAQKAAIETERDLLRDSLTDMLCQIDQSNAEHAKARTALETQLKDRQSALETSERKRAASEAERNLLRDNLANRMHQIEQMTTEHAEAQAGLKDRTATLKTLEREQAAIETERDLLRDSLTDMLCQIDQSNAEHAKARTALETQLKDRQSALETSERKRAASEAERNLLRDNLAQLLHETETQFVRQTTLETELETMSALEGKLSSLSGEMIQTQTALKNQSHELTQTQAQLALSLQDMQGLQAERDQLAHDAAVLSDTLSEVFASNSWKITSPIRTAMTRLRAR